MGNSTSDVNRSFPPAGSRIAAVGRQQLEDHVFSWDEAFGGFGDCENKYYAFTAHGECVSLGDAPEDAMDRRARTRTVEAALLWNDRHNGMRAKWLQWKSILWRDTMPVNELVSTEEIYYDLMPFWTQIDSEQE